MSKCQCCGYSGKARVEYLELLRPLERRIKNQRAELARLQPIAQWYSRYWGDPTAAPATSTQETLEDRQREPDVVEKQALYRNMRKLYRRDVPDETLDRSKPETSPVQSVCDRAAHLANVPTQLICNCAGIAPTMPTFRTEHLPTCPCSTANR